MHDETLTPHGIALVVASQRRGMLTWNEETVSVLYAEPDAGNCRAHCVTDQPLPAAIAAVRAQVAAQGLAPPVAYDLQERLKNTQSLFGEYVPTEKTGDIALFIGDEAHNLWPATTANAMKLLRAMNVDAVPVGMGLSSGYMACSLGFPSQARELAEQCIQEVCAAGARKVLTLSPKELFTFRQLYPERLGLSWPDDIELVDFVTYLADAHDQGKIMFQSDSDYPSTAYIDPTHSVRVPERFESARVLCTALLGESPHELFWRRERAHPVGNTALQFTRPEIAERLTLARLEDAVQRGAQILMCEDPGTLYALQQHASAFNVTVVGLYDALANALC